MAKFRTDPIEAADIDQYVASVSDFAFELAVLKKIIDLGVSCRHGGTYDDPVSRKTREFDIQAETTTQPANETGVSVRLAIECKNIRSNYPLVIHRVPRRADEAFHDVVWSWEPLSSTLVGRTYGERVRFSADLSLYQPGALVGKSADQVGKRPDGEVVASDSDVFDRITQALNSAYELLREAHYAGTNDDMGVATLVLPLLVVPQNTLWVVDYNDADSNVAKPSIVTHVSYFVDKDWLVGGAGIDASVRYTLSHLDICTIDYLKELITGIRLDERLSLNNVLQVNLEKLRERSGQNETAG